jgi:hypothetical protein
MLLQQKRENLNTTINNKSLIFNNTSNHNDHNFAKNSSTSGLPIKKTLIPKSNSVVSSPVSLIQSIQPKTATK